MGFAKTRSNVKQTRTIPQELMVEFISSRRQGLSPPTIEFYHDRLTRARVIIGIRVTSRDIRPFFDNLPCSNGNKHAYWRALTVFYRWLYSPKSGFDLRLQDNPMLLVESPKVEEKIFPSLSLEEINCLIDQAECLRDKAIISLFADSGLRLTELANIHKTDIEWNRKLIKVKCKGNKEGYAMLGSKTEALLREWLQYHEGNMLWDTGNRGITCMLQRLAKKTGLKCNPHTFRRSFASILAKRGVDCLHIMRLGRWEDLDMVERYTRSVKFEDSLKLYSPIVD
jgi:site-specific recombinase XerD